MAVLSVSVGGGVSAGRRMLVVNPGPSCKWCLSTNTVGHQGCALGRGEVRIHGLAAGEVNAPPPPSHTGSLKEAAAAEAAVGGTPNRGQQGSWGWCWRSRCLAK
jgi:hypothetical protein